MCSCFERHFLFLFELLNVFSLIYGVFLFFICKLIRYEWDFYIFS